MSMNLRVTMAILSILITGWAHGTNLTTAAEELPEVIRIAVEGAFPPFNYVSADNQLQGFDVDIADALCEAAKVACELVIQPWEQMIPGLLDGEYDAIVSSMSMSAERKALVDFSGPYYDSPSAFVARKGYEPQPGEPVEFAGVRLGVTSTTVQAEYARSAYPNANITIFQVSSDLYQGLADGAVDLILEDKLAAYDWLANTKAGSCCEFTGAEIDDPALLGEGAGVALRPGDAGLLQMFNQALAIIQTDGTYDMINAKYFPFSIR